VEQDERAVQPRDDQVLVVSRIGDNRRAVREPRQILEDPAGVDRQLRRIGRGVVERTARGGTAAVDGIQIERGCAPARRRQRLRGNAELRARVERDVVIDELAEERRAGRVRRVIRVVRAQARIGDQLHGARAQLIRGVEQPTRSRQRDERLHDAVARRRKRLQIGKEPPEMLRRRRREAAPRRRSVHRRGA
jgi:hypothetical protein